jgi:hypothetical protein
VYNQNGLLDQILPEKNIVLLLNDVDAQLLESQQSIVRVHHCVKTCNMNGVIFRLEQKTIDIMKTTV